MKINICAVGRLRSGPELSLVDDYLKRLERSGRGIGLGPAKFIEVEDKKGGGMAAEAALLRKAMPSSGHVMAMDERGKVMTSPKFATKLADIRDAGNGDLTILIGGADGLDPSLRAQADSMLSFGQMVWPHMLVRVMLSEQLYRAASILTGAPYHRE